MFALRLLLAGLALAAPPLPSRGVHNEGQLSADEVMRLEARLSLFQQRTNRELFVAVLGDSREDGQNISSEISSAWEIPTSEGAKLLLTVFALEKPAGLWFDLTPAYDSPERSQEAVDWVFSQIPEDRLSAPPAQLIEDLIVATERLFTEPPTRPAAEPGVPAAPGVEAPSPTAPESGSSFGWVAALKVLALLALLPFLPFWLAHEVMTKTGHHAEIHRLAGFDPPFPLAHGGPKRIVELLVLYFSFLLVAPFRAVSALLLRRRQP